MRPVGHGVIYAGIATAMSGFALIAYAWGKVAALLNVALQLPYVVSGGFTGVALIIVGMALVNIEVKRADAARRDRQLTQIADALRALAASSVEGAEEEDTARFSVRSAPPVPATPYRWDAAHTATWIGMAMTVAGFAALAIAWRGVAAQLAVPLQVPYALSGGIGGLALIGTGAAIATAQANRAAGAVERHHLGALRSASADMAGVLGTSSSHGSVAEDLVVPGRSTYHLATCPVAARLADTSQVPKGVAQERGLRACGRCQPAGTGERAATARASHR